MFEKHSELIDIQDTHLISFKIKPFPQQNKVCFCNIAQYNREKSLLHFKTHLLNLPPEGSNNMTITKVVTQFL